MRKEINKNDGIHANLNREEYKKYIVEVNAVKFQQKKAFNGIPLIDFRKYIKLLNCKLKDLF